MRLRRLDRLDRGELRSARELLAKNSLPLEGLSETELWGAWNGAGRLVGVAGLEKWGAQGLLRSVAVDEGDRRRGTGSALVRRVLKEAGDEGIAQVYLFTETAGGFFEKFGFRHVERKKVRGKVLQSVEFRDVCLDTPPMELTLN